MGKSDEQRSEYRLNNEVVIFIETESSPDEIQGERISVSKTLDISANGLQIIIDTPLSCGSLLQLCIQAQMQRFFITGEVVWVKPDNDQFLVGFQLLDSEHTDAQAWKEFICLQLDKKP